MSIKKIEKIVREILPPECGLTKVESEGLNIVVYIKDVNAFYSHDQLIKKLASATRKKIVVRADPSQLLPPDEAEQVIKEIVGKDAEITNTFFLPEFSEVKIEARKPGVVIGKGGKNLKEIMLKTRWSPEVLRTPTIPSATIAGLRKSMVRDSAERKKFLLNVGKKLLKTHVRDDWARVVMLGGFGEVGRSAMLLQTSHSRILIECGINAESFEPPKAYPYLNLLGFPIDQLDAVVVTHAHLDHMGFLPYLYSVGYDGPVYVTPPTRDLMALLQQDYINVAKKMFAQPPYEKKDIQAELKHVITVPYGEVVDIAQDVKLTFYNAGHILGSAIVHLHIGDGQHNVVFSGDFKFGFTRLFEPAHTVFPRIETLFIETTYGKKGDTTPSRLESEKRLIEVIKETVKNKGKVLIPVFAVGRSQEVLLVLEEYFRKQPDLEVPVYIDGMVMEASAIHTVYPEYLKESLRKRILSDKSPFEAQFIKVAKGKDKSAITNDGEPAVILAPSGMLTGGPSLEYFKLLADDPKNTIVFVGYQHSLSLGAKVQRGEKEVAVLGDDGRMKAVRVQMKVETVEGFSGHSDRSQLLAFIRNLTPQPKRIYTMHGELSKSEDFANTVRRLMKKSVDVPVNMEARRLF
jgi:KH/beta-lactamase-domain protein